MEERFTGAWRLESYEVTGADGEVTHPFGEKPEGMIVYDGQGHMSVHIMRQGVPPFAVDDRWMGTDGEVRAAFEGYTAYYGRYSVEADKGEVTHHVAGSVFPNYIGRKLVRRYEFSGDKLTLSTPPMSFGGKEGLARLVWVRMQAVKEASADNGWSGLA